jgi:Icc-related predicted phosphoesterase
MFTLAHVSDTHNNPGLVRQACQSSADVVLVTGDCMNNLGRVSRTEYQILPHAEVKYQQSWYRKQAKKWAADLAGRPIIAVRGNHDFIDYAPWLRHYGAEVHEITDDCPAVEVLGKRWAGFRQINYLAGEWSGEEHSLGEFVQLAFDCKPDILVTHARREFSTLTHTVRRVTV